MGVSGKGKDDEQSCSRWAGGLLAEIHWFCILCLLVQSSIVLARAQKTHPVKGVML